MQNSQSHIERPTIDAGNRIRALREASKLTQEEVAQKIGVKRSTVARWENGTSSSKNGLEKLAGLFNVTMDYIAKGVQPKKSPPNPDVVRVPVLGRVAAGIPIEAIQEVDDWEEIYHPGAGNDKFFGLRIHGASMEPRLREGDTVIVKKQDYFESGDVCIVLVNGNEATVKVVQKKTNGIVLIGYNAAVYPPHFYSAQEVETLPVRIIGVVIEFRCKP